MECSTYFWTERPIHLPMILSGWSTKHWIRLKRMMDPLLSLRFQCQSYLVEGWILNMPQIYLIKRKDGSYLNLSVYWEEYQFYLFLLSPWSKVQLLQEAACSLSLMILFMWLIKQYSHATKLISVCLSLLECYRLLGENTKTSKLWETCACLVKNSQVNKLSMKA